MKRLFIAIFTVLLFSATGVYAELHDRGGGLIYDDVLNITWLQDTNYAKTSGYDADGSMNWYEAMAWVDQLEYAVYDDWRLPTSAGGAGYNITGGEMGHLYYVTLGNLGYTSPEGTTP